MHIIIPMGVLLVQVTVQEGEFLKNHGDKLWLKGIQFLPARIKNLLHLNKVLAHQPWLVKTQHIKVLLGYSKLASAEHYQNHVVQCSIV